MGCGDDYKDEKLDDVLEMIMDKNILLYGIEIIKWTEQMYTSIKTVFKQKNRSEYFHYVQSKNVDINILWQLLTQIVYQGTETPTQQNSSLTVSKLKRTKINCSKLSRFDIKLFQTFQLQMDQLDEQKFEVYKIGFDKQIIESLMTMAYKISKTGFILKYMDTWDCRMTKLPFAQGSKKQVHLMAQQCDLQKQLYAIKFPLKSFYINEEEAILACRTHLIAKIFLEKFMLILKEKQIQKNLFLANVPELQYLDIFILKDQYQHYWIAERYLEGDFIKYNNNWGFIKNCDSIMTKLSLAFSYFTYYLTNFNFMINDIQGVGEYFTDPVINTEEGGYDETDTGFDGLSMFWVSFEQKKYLVKEILDIMDIELY
ncbi:hypothetical protein pb186bvf_011333 [Paramecium bursaria]